jgi:hypothetical protein
MASAIIPIEIKATKEIFPEWFFKKLLDGGLSELLKN